MKKQAIILKCRPETLFHLGRVAVDSDTSLNDTSEFIHSDTLAAALMALGIKVLPEQTAAVLALFGWQSTPSVKLSSAFYCLEKAEQMLYFLPKPISLNLEKMTTVAGGKNHKDLKSVKFLSKSVLENDLKPAEWFDPIKCQTVQKGKFVVTKEEATVFGLTDDSKIYDIIPMPKVAVRTPTKANTFYYQTNIQLGNLTEQGVAIHFYFLADFDPQIAASDRNLLNTLFRLLPSEGIGGERAAGCGYFLDTVFTDFDWQKQGEKALSLSLTNPKDDAEFKQFDYYQLTTRGGRMIDSKRQLAKVQMIAEGAVLKTDNVTGRVVNLMLHNKVNNDTDHLRSGICLTLPY